MTIQADCSIGFKKETTYGTAVTVDRFLEFTSESLDFEREFYQGEGLRPGTRVARSGRRVLVKDGGSGDIELEVPSRGIGALLELLMGVGAATLVPDTTGVYQQLFTLADFDYLPSATVQKGIPRLGANTVDAITFTGAQAASFELSIGNAEVLKLKTTWTAQGVTTGTAYAVPSYPADIELFDFVGAELTVGGTPTVPTATALATGGTPVANVRDFSIEVDQKLDDNGFNMGGKGKRSRPAAVGIAEVKGKITGEYDSIAFRDAVVNQEAIALVATFQAPSLIEAGYYPTIQVVVPDVRFEGELPKSNGGDVISQSIDFTVLDGLVAAEPLYVVARTADTAL